MPVLVTFGVVGRGDGQPPLVSSPQDDDKDRMFPKTFAMFFIKVRYFVNNISSSEVNLLSTHLNNHIDDVSQ